MECEVLAMGYSLHKRYRPRPDWLDTVKVGDVLMFPSGGYRVVRAVHHHKEQRPNGVNWRFPILSFAIRRCSWTGRPYTVYTANDLQTMGVEHTGASVVLDSIQDHALEDAINAKDSPVWKLPVTCCMATDMP